jgi:hypothetical protein
MAPQDSSAKMAETHYGPGQAVPCSGVYRISHAAHREDHDGILFEGQVFPACIVCGSEVQFQLIQASNPIGQQADFKGE